MTEKQQLQETPGPAPFPPPQPPPHARTLARQRSRWVLTAFVLLAMLASVHLSSSGGLAGCLQRSASPGSHAHTEHEVGGPIPAQSIGGKAPACPAQPPALPPRTTVAWTDARRAHSAELHAQAVQHATQSYDDNGEPGEDPRWEPFHDFLRWWRDAFPVAVGKAKIEMINTLGILATFEGSDPSLKPLVLMSHYDVTPAPENTWSRWTHAPFSGHNDGTYIWGRGSADDKSLFVAQWEAVTYLLEAGWAPRRTLILSHGFDEEEVHARRGQGQIAPVLEARYGAGGVLMVVDEGSGVQDDLFGAPFALPAMGEKGYLDVRVSVGTTGGHSSVPPPHTGIGVLSELVVALERSPLPAALTARSPFLTTLACAAAHAPAFPRAWKALLRKGPPGWAKLARRVAGKDATHAALLHTTQAVDVFRGGAKVNSLPELAEAEINYRIDFAESVAGTQRHIERIAAHVASNHGLRLDAWPESNATTESGTMTLSVIGHALEPAPNTPAHGGVWDTFAGTVRAVFQAPGGRELIVAPFATTGNTDCKMYYNLTDNVYRFMGLRMDDMHGMHTVDEHSSLKGHRDIVDFMHALIQNADAYDGKQ